MKIHFIDSLIAHALKGGVPLFIFILSFICGAFALTITPREEEPQIVVPIISVEVDVPNLLAPQIERQVTIKLEKLLKQVSGVEHIYSTTRDNHLLVTLRFHVGEDREDALLNTYNKLYSSQDKVPAVVGQWQVEPVEVDDVPTLLLGIYSTAPDLYGDYALRRLSEEVSTLLQQVENTSVITVTGGRPRELQVLLDNQALYSRSTTGKDVVNSIFSANSRAINGNLTLSSSSVRIESGDIFQSKKELEDLVVNVVNGSEVLLKDVASVIDGPGEPSNYQWLEHAQKANHHYPMVTISVAKHKGSNAVKVANDVLLKLEQLNASIFPEEIKIEVLRNYGETADEKVNNLTSSLLFAIFTVVVFVGVFLGWRSAAVVGLAVPICYGLTLFLDWLFGYSINRVTLFALILSLGLLVDDPISGIDNISRYLSKKGKDVSQSIVNAMSEIRPALLMSTLTIILAFVPLAFITGMMGPYMAPMAFNVPVSVAISTLVAFFVTPWLAKKFLRTTGDVKPSGQLNFYRKMLSPILESKTKGKAFLILVLLLFLIACLLPVMRAVPLKLLPYDNKNELQVLIDMPENSTLEMTANLAKEVAQIVKSLPEVNAVGVYVGEPSAMDFNGLVRQYYNRQGAYLGDLRVTLMDKQQREHQSHGVVLRLRDLLKPFNKDGVLVKVVEVPPGPPVMSTLVVEIYKSPLVAQEVHHLAAQKVMKRLEAEPHVVEIDSTITAPQNYVRFVTDKRKAALSGITTQDVNYTLELAVKGINAGTYHQLNEANPIPITVKTPYQRRNDLTYLQSLQVAGQTHIRKTVTDLKTEDASKPFVSLAEIGQWESAQVSQPIYRKDLQPVVYVTAELNGRTPAEVIADVNSDLNKTSGLQEQTRWDSRSFLNSGGTSNWSLPSGTAISFSGEGEWRITVDVFRDMGIAFAFALTGIFFVLRYQTGSKSLSLIIMSSIPLTVIGIMPGFWLLNQFGERQIAGAPEPVLFTATAMIGMIALAGIVVRNSLILIEFVNLALSRGLALKEALITAGQVRMRPVLLTAGTTLLGNLVIILDPVFSGLALAIIFGIIASTLFSLFVVPIVYFLAFSPSITKGVN